MGKQTAVNEFQTNAFAGMKADLSPSSVDSRVNEEGATELPFGVMVFEGSTDPEGGMLQIAAQADEPAGVLLHSHAYLKDQELGATGLKPNVVGGVLKKGVVWVQVEEAVTPASTVRYRTSGGNGPGTFRTSAVVTNTVNISQFARYLSSAAANGLAKLEIDMTNRALRSND